MLHATKNHGRGKNQTGYGIARFEDLESRRLYSAGMSAEMKNYSTGPAILVNGTGGDDTIKVYQTANGITVTDGGSFSKTFTSKVNSIIINGSSGDDVILLDTTVKVDAFIKSGTGNDVIVGGSAKDRVDGGWGDDVIYGQAGNDFLYGNKGNDSMYGGTGSDKMFGYYGDDTLIAVGGGADSFAGQEGFDNIWSDQSSVDKLAEALSDLEQYNCAWKQVGEFVPFYDANGNPVNISKELAGQDLPDPMLTDTASGYTDMSSNPLFGPDGPHMDDVNQGGLGTCYFLAALSAMADTNPQWVQQSVVAFGDGTYGVMFLVNNSEFAFVRVDGDLPVTASGSLAYSNFGQDESIWVAIMEKAWAYFRDPSMLPGGGASSGTSYGNCEGTAFNTLYEAFNNLGGYNVEQMMYTDISNGHQLLTWIKHQLDQGKGVIFGSVPTNGVPVITGGGHAYTVVDVVTGSDGQLYLVLRNPWGVDGNGVQGADDGYISLTADQAIACFVSVAAANV